MSQKKDVTEYQQVAAILSFDIEILFEVSKEEDITKESLMYCIKEMFDEKNRLIENDEYRQTRYSMMSMLFKWGSQNSGNKQ